MDTLMIILICGRRPLKTSLSKLGKEPVKEATGHNLTFQ